jgi:hypothetical protein
LDDVTAGVVGGLAERHWELSLVVRAGERAGEERKQINEQLLKYMPGKKVVTGSGIEVVRVDGSRAGLDLDSLAQDLGLTVPVLKAKYEKPSSFVYFKTKRKGDD